MITLGGNIQLSGFNEIDSGHKHVVKKIVGNYARKFSDVLESGYEELSITSKEVHGNKSHINIKLIVKGKPINAEETGNNMLVTLAKSLKKIESQITK